MPFTPQPTNNPVETKILNTTHNIIAENDIYLKERADIVDSDLGQAVNPDSSPNFENITLTGMTGTVEGRIETNTSDIADNASDISTNATNFSNNINQAVKTTSSPTFAGLTLNGNLLPETTPSESSVVVNTGSTYTIPRGMYYVKAITGGSAVSASLQKYINGGWLTVDSTTTTAILGSLNSATGSSSGAGALRISAASSSVPSTVTIILQKG